MYATTTIGASGAVYGVLLAYALYFPIRTILFMFIFPLPAKIFVMMSGAISLYSAMGGGGGVAHTAHLGGLVAFFFSSRRRHTRWNCDWSSDVCSSDLIRRRASSTGRRAMRRDTPDLSLRGRRASRPPMPQCRPRRRRRRNWTARISRWRPRRRPSPRSRRSEERRVGKEGRSRWWTEHG